MNRKAMIEKVCNYILDQDHEYEDMVNDMQQEYMCMEYEEDVKQAGRNRIWYTATLLLHGKRIAEKGIKDAYKEAKRAGDEQRTNEQKHKNVKGDTKVPLTKIIIKKLIEEN